MQTVSGAFFRCRYALSRAVDSRQSAEPSQDFLALAYDENRLIFVLCDGVSQSFYGDLGARLLGNALIGWLVEETVTLANPEVLSGQLFAFLQGLTTSATEQVQEYPLPDGLPPLVGDVLEEKRMLGTESMFICGRLDAPSLKLPRGQLLLAAMGDSRVRLWDRQCERTVGWSPDPALRWSSVRGPVGEAPGVYFGPLTDWKRVTAYSDGLAVYDNESEAPSDEALTALISATEEAPVSDDVTFLEIDLQSLDGCLLPAPVGVEITQAGCDHQMGPRSEVGCVAGVETPPWQSGLRSVTTKLMKFLSIGHGVGKEGQK